MRTRWLPQLPWWKRGLVAGASGTAAMAVWYHAERTARRGRYTGVKTLADGTPVEGLWSHEGLDYDDSVVPGRIVANLLRLPTPTDREAGALTLALRWTYGSAFGIAHVLLRNKIRAVRQPDFRFGTDDGDVGGLPGARRHAAAVEVAAGRPDQRGRQSRRVHSDGVGAG